MRAHPKMMELQECCCGSLRIFCETDDTEVCTTCASAILICATVFSGIFLAVMILVFVLIAKAIITGKLKKKDPEEEEETKSEIGEA